jgi:Protein of unknown function (DUF3570)
MQLRNIKGKVSLATCSLLQVASPLAQAEGSDWDIDTAFLYYSESDGRVQASEPAIYAGRDLGEDNRIDLRLVVDVLTGATPNGAHATSVPQTFTTPSGGSSYTAAAGETPLDDTFHDTRVAAGADWTISLDRLSKLVLGLNVSSEFDYVSAGISSTYMRDFNNRNTTLTAGVAFNSDTVTPVGGVPIEFAPMVQPNSTLNRDGSSETKTLTDFIIGVTQVVNRKTIFQLNYTFGMTDGYQNDPYKILTVYDPVTGLPGLPSAAAAGDLPYVYEKRPDSRQRNALFFNSAHHLTEDVIHFSYRYYWDDWGINSHTLDLRYRYQLANSYLMPHVRYYTQDAADFYTHNLILGTDIDAATGVVNKDYASHDYRLAKSVTTTLGLKYGIPLSKDSEISVRGEMIQQAISDDGVPAGEETPDLDALVLQVNYSLLW